MAHNLDYNKITTEEFDHALSDILNKMTGEQFMAIPGVYEVVNEHFNNEVLDLALEKFHSST